MKRKVILFIIAGTLTVAHRLSAQQESPAQESKPATFNLQERLRYALENSYEVHKAQFGAEEASALHKEAKGALLPQVNGSASATNNLRLPVTYMPGDFFGAQGENIGVELGVKYSTVAGIDLEQVVFDAGLFTGIKISRNARELAELKKNMTREELIYNIGNAFYDIVYSQKLLKSNVETLAIMDSIYRKMELRVTQNIIREVELNRMKVNVSNMNVDIRKTFATLAQQKNYLKILMGMPLEYDFEVEEMMQPASLAALLPENMDYDVSNRIELQILDNEKKTNELKIKQLRQSYLPALSLFASYSHNFENEELTLGNSNFWSTGVYFGVKLSVPLFDG
jgi:outer membrane protein TolC